MPPPAERDYVLGTGDEELELPRWLDELGFSITRLAPIVDVVPPTNFIWQWPAAFVHSGLKRLVELGDLTPARGDAIARAFTAAEHHAGVLMVTPAVLEIVAVRGK